jgi:hypothetical protein
LSHRESMGGGWEDRGSPGWLVDGKAIGSEVVDDGISNLGCQSRTWGQEVAEDDEEGCGTIRWPGGRQSTLSMAASSQRKKRLGMELYPVVWLAARAQRCCYTFNRGQRCGSLARTAMEVDSGGVRW